MTDEVKYLPIEFKPGISRDLTEYASENSWYSMDKVRFRKGYPQSIGGWQKITPNYFKGIARRNIEWSLLNGTDLLGLGTHSHVYIWQGGVFNNITPVSVSASTTNILNTTAGAVSVVVSIPSHGRSVGDYYYVISQQTTVGGNVYLSGYDYEITTVNGTNSFTIETSTTAAATSTAAGGSLNYLLQIQTGYQENNVAFGWGRSSWSSGAYGTAVSSGIIRKMRLWSMNNWGEDLLFNYKGGSLYLWDATNGLGTRGTIVTAAPSIIDYSFIAQPARHCVAIGTTDVSSGVYDPLLIRWSDSENYNDWGVSAANQGGFYRLQGGSEVLGVRQSRTEAIIWTDAGVHRMAYTGSNDVFSFDQLGEQVHCVGPTATVDLGGVLYWMGDQGFFSYDGQIKQLPCTIQKDIFDYDGEFQIDLTQKEKVFAGTNTTFGEIIWFYQSVFSTTSEVDRYVIYNYLENLWYYGTLDRTTWLDVGINGAVLATGTDGFIYTHELGLTADNAPLDSYIESAPFDLGDGDKMLFVDRIVPDFQLTGSLGVTFTTRKYPNAPEEIKGPYIVEPTTTKIDLRTRGRQAKIRIGTSAVGSAWKLGKLRVRVKEDGGR